MRKTGGGTTFSVATCHLAHLYRNGQSPADPASGYLALRHTHLFCVLRITYLNLQHYVAMIGAEEGILVWKASSTDARESFMHNDSSVQGRPRQSQTLHIRKRPESPAPAIIPAQKPHLDEIGREPDLQGLQKDVASPRLFRLR